MFCIMLKFRVCVGWVSWCIAIALVLSIMSSWACSFAAPNVKTFQEGKASNWPFRIPSHWPRTPTTWVYADTAGQSVDGYTAQMRHGTTSTQCVMLVRAYGVPMRSLITIDRFEQASAASTIQHSSVFDRGAKVFGRGSTQIGTMRIAFRPLPVGIVVNGVLFAVVCVALFGGFKVIQRKRRDRNGACLQCGYSGAQDLKICPECGQI